MDYNIDLQPLATLEVLDAYEWYESVKTGLGFEFLEEVERFYNSLLRNPYIHSFYRDKVRQGSLSKFPYSILYEIFDDTIMIYSVFMTRQNPRKKY